MCPLAQCENRSGYAYDRVQPDLRVFRESGHVGGAVDDTLTLGSCEI